MVFSIRNFTSNSFSDKARILQCGFRLAITFYINKQTENFKQNSIHLINWKF